MSTATVSAADLRAIDLFDDLDDQRLAAWAAAGRATTAAAGDVLVREGEAPRAALLLLEGAVQTYVIEQARSEPAGRHQAPTWMLAIAVLTMGTVPVRLVADTDCRLVEIDGPDFERLLLSHPEVHRRVMLQVAPVTNRISAMEHERERLASLGTMAAGLAHELNNPASAARRAAEELAQTLETVGSTVKHFVESGMERAQAARLVELQDEALARAAACTAGDVLDAADAEDEMLDLLEELGVPDAWRLAEPLAAAHLDRAWVERVARHAGSALPSALGWVAASLTARGLADELRDSTKRVSDLVAAVKTYAYMDRGEVLDVDLHEGLDTTLVVLKHKLKHTAIEVNRDYDRSMPHVLARGPELNQVWTNLLDNAIHALGDSGTITITTRRDGDRALVEIADDGPGIPHDVRPRIFDAFYTTKEVGQGTGLGLATARRIVVDRHDGALTVESEPGRTVFTVCLPYAA